MSVVAASQATTTNNSSSPIPPSDAVTVPRFQVDLDAPKGTRWNHIIEIYKGAIKSAESQIDQVVKKEAPTLAAIGESMLSVATKTGLVYYGDELVGISKASGVSVGRLTAMQLVYEAAAACTSVTFQSKHRQSFGAHGAPAHCRNMDWEMDFLRALTIEVEFIRQGKPVCLATTWAGYVGVLTGMGIRDPEPTAPNKPRNVSVSVNFRVTEKGTYWDNLKKTLGRAWPVGFLLREVLTDPAVSYATAVAQLSASEVIAPTYLTVCGSGTGEGCLITRDRTKAVNTLQIDYSPSFPAATTTTPTTSTTTTGGGGTSTNSVNASRSEAPREERQQSENTVMDPEQRESGTTDRSEEGEEEERLQEEGDAAPTPVSAAQIPGTCTTTTSVANKNNNDGKKKMLPAATMRDNTVVCNMDHWGSADIFYSKDRVRCAEGSLTKLRNKKTLVTIEDLWALLSVSPVRNELTVYGTVMIPATGYYETRLPRSGAIGYVAKVFGSAKQ